jgi:hypothetical protein
LERIAGDRPLEYQEVIGYHLEQAHRYRAELGLTDDLTAALSARAVAHLRAAGQRALARNDRPAALNLLARAAALTPDDADRTVLLLDAADSATVTGDMARAHRHVLVIHYQPGRQKLAHQLLLADPLNGNFIGVGQVERNPFDLNRHISLL